MHLRCCRASKTSTHLVLPTWFMWSCAMYGCQPWNAGNMNLWKTAQPLQKVFIWCLSMTSRRFALTMSDPPNESKPWATCQNRAIFRFRPHSNKSVLQFLKGWPPGSKGQGRDLNSRTDTHWPQRIWSWSKWFICSWYLQKLKVEFLWNPYRSYIDLIGFWAFWAGGLRWMVWMARAFHVDPGIGGDRSECGSFFQCKKFYEVLRSFVSWINFE